MSLHLLADDAEVLRAAAEWLTRGKRVALVTVLKTWGSSPRPPGSLLVIGSDGEMAGSVSGGCVEETLVARHRAGELGADTPTLV
ncbi:MAG: XdhC family protein, partial [Gammaproteobacteria bacterium]|nr:XdhC family protein [Gammaproteobacteria bacterium]